MADEGSRVEVLNEHAARQSSEPQPIRQTERRVSWADLTEEEEELHIHWAKIEKN